MIATLPLLLLLTAPDATSMPVSSASAKDELRFGIRVAQRGLWREARFRFERAVDLAPENANALNNLGVALEQDGAFDEAREAYEKALQLDPDNIYIQQNYDLFREADDKRNRKARRNRGR